MARFVKFLLVLLIMAHLVVLSYAGYHGYQEVFRVRSIPQEQLPIHIPQGWSLSQVLDSLHDRELSPNPLIVRAVMRLKKFQPVVKHGRYRLPASASTFDILKKMDDGRVLLHRLTIPEGLDKWETAKLLGESRWGDEPAFLTLINRTELIRDIDPDATDLEGYLFPETYFFSDEANAEDIVRTLVQEFRRKTDPLRPQLAARGLNLREWLTLASLVEEEAAIASEQATIAGVFDKRLGRGMLLQCDPTIIYSLKLEQRYRGKIYRSDIRFDHPYNTYVSSGLPPGPIANPGQGALMAALEPSDNPYLFFVAKEDGSHYFSRTLGEHNRAVNRYLRSRGK